MSDTIFDHYKHVASCILGERDDIFVQWWGWCAKKTNLGQAIACTLVAASLYLLSKFEIAFI